MSISVSISGLSEIDAQIDKNYEKQLRRANRAVHSAALTCQKVAKQNCPVGTPESTGIKGYHGGRLRQSIHVTRTAFDAGRIYVEYTVGTNVFYAIFVHEGTVKMQGRPFLRKGFEAGAKQLLADLGEGEE
jgi:HK97 gp10 family phage protein